MEQQTLIQNLINKAINIVFAMYDRVVCCAGIRVCFQNTQ